MKWFEKLDATKKEKINALIDERKDAVVSWDMGELTADEAQGIVARCNREIARIAGGAA